jgi:hypothetical protein
LGVLTNKIEKIKKIYLIKTPKKGDLILFEKIKIIIKQKSERKLFL